MNHGTHTHTSTLEKGKERTFKDWHKIKNFGTLLLQKTAYVVNKMAFFEKKMT